MVFLCIVIIFAVGFTAEALLNPESEFERRERHEKQAARLAEREARR